MAPGQDSAVLPSSVSLHSLQSSKALAPAGTEKDYCTQAGEMLAVYCQEEGGVGVGKPRRHRAVTGPLAVEYL